MTSARTSNTIRDKGRKPARKLSKVARKLRKLKPACNNSVPSPSSPHWLHPFDKEPVAWMLTMLRLYGGLWLPSSPSSYSPVTTAAGQRRRKPVTQSRDEITKRLTSLMNPLAALRKPATDQVFWKAAYGNSKALHDKADFYLRLIDHKEMELFDNPSIVLAKTVCNLRNYYQQTKAQTVALITTIYNPLCRINWSEEDIELTWDLVEGFTPSLWLQDERYLSRMRAAEVQRELRDLLDHLTPGGRIPVLVMVELLNQWDTSLNVSKREVGDAMRAITGNASKPSNGVSYYNGVQLPLMPDHNLKAYLT